MPNRTAVPESVFCENCPEQIVQSPPQDNRPGRYVNGSTRRAEWPSNPHGSTLAEPRRRAASDT